MPEASVAIAVTDPALRLLVAQAFDGAPQAWAVSFSDVERPDADVVVFDDDPGGKGVIFDLARPDRLIADIRAHLDGASPSAPCRTVAVTGMPGAGVTSIAVHLASIWGRGSETCFVDLDRSWSCAPRLALGDEVVTWAMRSKRLDGAGSLSIPLAPGVRALVAPLGDSSVLAATVVKRQPRDPNGSCWTCRTGIGSRRSPLRSIR